MNEPLEAVLAELGPGHVLVEGFRGGEGQTAHIRGPDGVDRVLKVLPPDATSAEGALLSSLSHPAIAAVERIGRFGDGRPFVLRRYVPGEALVALPEAPEVLLPLVQQLLEVLAFVHLRGVLHLDLKPQNLVLDPQGRLHLLDFGMAVRGGARSRGGTPFYAAPELLLGVTPDPRADLFAVGAMVAQALRPRGAIALDRFVAAFPGVDFCTAAGFQPDDLPSPFGRFVARCVERQPERRFPDAVSALESLIGGGGRPSVALLLPDACALYADQLSGLDGDAFDVVLRGACVADRRALAMHVAVQRVGAQAIEERPDEVRVVRGGGSERIVELPPIGAERLAGHLRQALGLEGVRALHAAHWLTRQGAQTSAGVAATLATLVERGEVLPAGARWTWPDAVAGRLHESAPAESSSAAAVGADQLRALAASGRFEGACAHWRAAQGDPARERELRSALVEGLLDGGEPARALALSAGLPLLRAQALLHAGQIAAAARELATVPPEATPRYRVTAAQLAMAGGQWRRARELLDHPDATAAEQATLAAALEQAGALDECERVLAACEAELSPDASPHARATALTVRGHVARRGGRLAAARDCFAAAFELFHSIGHVRHAASELLNLGVIHKDLGELAAASDRFREARALYQHVGDEARAAIATANLGIATLALGEPAAARATLEEALPVLVRLGERSSARLAAVLLARACAELGDREAAAANLHIVGRPDSERLIAEVAAVVSRLRAGVRPADDGDRMPPPAQNGPSRELFRTFLAVNRQLGQARDLDAAMQQLLQASITLTGGRTGFLLVMHDDGMRREFEVGEPSAGQAFSRSLAHRAIQEQRTLTGADALGLRELQDNPSVRDLQVRSAICAPFRSAGGTTGAIYVDHPGRSGVFDDGDKEALEVLADQAAIAVDRMTREQALRQELESSRKEVVAVRSVLRRDPPRLLGDSPAIKALRAQIEKVAPLELTVLVHGETGTGKELVARALHELGARPRGPFVAENCSALPAELMERELFGHVAGSFTGADRDRPGLLEAASGGTLFLDEIGDMPMVLQVKLLRALQERVVRRIGSDEWIPIDIRVVSATHKDLRAMVQRGEFREDLFFRLAAVELRVPPLRERTGDIEVLARHFAAAAGERRGRSLRLTPFVLAALRDHAWPGNVRELEHVVGRAALLADGDEIVDLQLPSPLVTGRSAAAGAGADAAGMPVMTLREAERRAIVAALQACGGDKAKTARALGISRTALYDKLRRHDLAGGGDA